jgi:hypothetical protein
LVREWAIVGDRSPTYLCSGRRFDTPDLKEAKTLLDELA